MEHVESQIQRCSRCQKLVNIGTFPPSVNRENGLVKRMSPKLSGSFQDTLRSCRVNIDDPQHQNGFMANLSLNEDEND